MKLFKDGTEVELTGLADQLSTIAENSPKVFESGLSIFRKLVSRDENLTKITAEDLGEITIIGDHAFDGCTYLESIEIPATVKEIGEWVFEECKNLKSIEIPLTVKSINKHAFYGTSLESITLPFVGENSENRDGTGAWHFSYIFGDGLNNQGYPTSGYVPSSLKTVIITGGTRINHNAFYFCSRLEKVVLPDTVEFIGGGTFNGCTKLKELTIPFVGENKDGSGAPTHFGYIFGAPSYDDNENSVPSSLKTVIITGGSRIGSYAFQNCTSLKSIVLPSSVTSIGSYAFRNCKSLKSITIPSSVRSIGQDAFNSCESLESITIPSGVTSIGPGTFGGCKSFKSITIPSGVTYIGSYAFQNCTSLKSIEIPSSVTYIGDWVFNGCTSFEYIYFQGNYSQWKAISKGSSWNSGMEDYGIRYNHRYD